MSSRNGDILRLYSEGLKIKDIAKRVGMAANTVGVILKSHGVSRPVKPQKKVKTYDEAKIVELWDHGLSTSAIAERVALSRASVGDVLVRHGRDIAAANRQRYDGEGGTIARGGNAFARIARRT